MHGYGCRRSPGQPHPLPSAAGCRSQFGASVQAILGCAWLLPPQVARQPQPLAADYNRGAGAGSGCRQRGGPGIAGGGRQLASCSGTAFGRRRRRRWRRRRRRQRRRQPVGGCSAARTPDGDPCALPCLTTSCAAACAAWLRSRWSWAQRTRRSAHGNGLQPSDDTLQQRALLAGLIRPAAAHQLSSAL